MSTTKDVDIQLGQKNSAWFSANSALVLKYGQVVYLLGVGTFKIGDGTTPLVGLPFRGGSGSNVYHGATPSTIAVGAYPVNSDLTGKTYDDLLANIYAPYVPPIITLNSISPQQEYNAININLSINLKWTRGNGAPDLLSSQIQYKRAADVSWNNITTTNIPPLPSSTNIINVGATVNINPSVVNNDTVQFKGIFTDSIGTTESSIYMVTFKSYVLPLATLSLNTNWDSNGKPLRRFTLFSGVISGSITRNSPNINLSTYKIQVSYDGASYIDKTSDVAIAAGGGTLALNGGNVNDTIQPINKDNYYIRASIKDGQNPSGVNINNIINTKFYQPIFYGLTNATTPSTVVIPNLNIVPNGIGDGLANYNNVVDDKKINKLNFVASNNRFCIAFDASYGNLTTFFDNGSNLNLLPNFTMDVRSVTFADGTTKNYRVYLYNLVVSSGTYSININ